MPRGKEVTDGFLSRLPSNFSAVSLNRQTPIGCNIQLVPHNTGVTLSEFAINWSLLLAHGLVELAIAPQDSGVGAWVTAVQGVFVIQEDCSLDGRIWIRTPGQNGFAPGHPNVVVKLPCTVHMH